MLDLSVYKTINYKNNSYKDNNIFLNNRLIELICENYPLTEYKNILEVGGGSGYFAKQLTKIGYNMTIMDPKSSNIEGINTIKERFDLTKDITNYDLVISIYGCQTADFIIKSCAENKKDFFVLPCTDECSYMKMRNSNMVIVKEVDEILKQENIIEEPIIDDKKVYYKKRKK